MNVIATRVKKKDKPRIFHKYGCIYEHRIKPQNRYEINVFNISSKHFCPCKYCSGIEGDIRINKNAIKKWKKKYNMQLIYDDKTDTLYFRTQVGFWKIFIDEKTQKYLLYHKNFFYEDMTDDEGKRGTYHRQNDVKETESLQKIIEYIGKHDRAKLIIADDYRKLPHSTKREKKYYKIAEKKVKRKERKDAIRRIDELFKLL